MKRLLPMLSGVLTAVLASCPAGWGQEIVPAPASAATPKNHGAVHAANEKLVRDLVAILKKTKSSDTFLVTVKALADMGPRSKAAVPAIILNGERLGLFKDIMQQADDDDPDSAGDFIVEAIEHIVAPRHERQAPRPGAPIAYPPVPAQVPPPCVVSPLMCPAAPPGSLLDAQPQKTARQ